MFLLIKIFFITFLININLSGSSLSSLLFHGNCITCHAETKTISAPSVLQLKEVYKNTFPQKKDFIKYMSTWVQYPDETTTLMYDAVEKHGLMPELGFDLNTLEQISEYIYDTDFTKKHDGHR